MNNRFQRQGYCEDANKIIGKENELYDFAPHAVAKFIKYVLMNHLFSEMENSDLFQINKLS